MSLIGGGPAPVTAEELEIGRSLFRERYEAYRDAQRLEAERRALVEQAVLEREERRRELELAAQRFGAVPPALAQDADYRRARQELVDFAQSLRDRPLPAMAPAETREEVSLAERHRAEDKRLDQILAEMERAAERARQRERERAGAETRERPSREDERKRDARGL